MALTQISTAGVKDDAVTSGKIPANAVGSSELADNAVDTAAIATDAVTGPKIADDAIGSNHYVDGSINAAHLNSSAVTTSKLNNNAVDASKLASNAVTSAKIADDAVTTNKIQDNAVSTAKINGGAVTTAKIADEAVTLAKLEHGTSSNDGKFLRANNGADPTFETVNTDLSADSSPQLGGNLDCNGSNIFLDDNNKIHLGNLSGSAGDLQIHHVPADNFSYIDTFHHLAIRKDNGAKTHAKFINNGAVELYHDNSKRIETESNGVTTTGGRLRIQNSGDVGLTISDTSTNAVSGFLNVKTAGRLEYNCYKSGVGTKYPHVFVGYTEEYARIDTNGIKFNGDTAAANALDDYEEGTWTVTVHNGFASGLTYNTQAGHYRKIGSLVEFNFFLLFQNESNDTNGSHIKINLPFTQDYTNSNRGHGVITYHNIQSPYPDGQNPHLYIYNSKAELYSANGTAFSGGNGSNQGNRYIIGGGSYHST